MVISFQSLGPILTGDDESLQQENNGGDGSPSCLVAIGRLQLDSMPSSKDLIESAPATEFITRHTLEGIFSFVDQRYAFVIF